MNLTELFLGQIPEAIYFALFLVFTKKLNDKRCLFIGATIIEYLLLLYSFPYSIWFHIGFFILTFILVRLLYPNKCRVTDLFTLGIASCVLVPVSVISFIVCNGNMIIGSLVNRGLLVLLFVIFGKKLPKIENIYSKFWNRNDKVKKRIKSTTFRAISLVAFNLSFFILNMCMVIAIIYNKGGG